MFSQAIRYLVPVGVGVAVYVPTTVYAKSESDGCKKKKITPADVYDEPAAPASTKGEDSRVTELEKCVKVCREGLGPVKDDVAKFSSQATVFFNDSMGVVKENVDYLRNKAPQEVKYAAIGGSSLLGLLLGFRKGLIRKLLYSSVLGGAAFSTIYPKEAQVYGKEGLAMAKKYGKVAYNFVVLGPGAKEPKKMCPVKRNVKEKKEREKECPPTDEKA